MEVYTVRIYTDYEVEAESAGEAEAKYVAAAQNGFDLPEDEGGTWYPINSDWMIVTESEEG